MIQTDSDENQTKEDLYEPISEQKQSKHNDDYQDMQIELHGSNRKTKYKWPWAKLK